MKTNIISLQQVIYVILLFLGLSLSTIQAQMRVGQPAGSPDGSAALDVSGGPYANGSPYRGMAPPKVALIKSTSATPVTSPATGLLIYNTATQNDVTPGYYYWDSNKWLRFSTSSNSGSARIAVAGDPTPAYTLSQVHSWVITGVPPTNIMLIELGREGLFRLDDSADTTNATDAMVVITAAPITHRYKRVFTDGTINVKWFGAVGQGGSVQDHPAIQRAVNYAKSLVTIGDGSGAGYRATVLFPPGYYGIYKPIDATKLNGVTLRGSGGRYANACLIGNTGGIMVDFSGSSNSGCENLGFQSFDGNPGFASTIGVQFALNTPPVNTDQGGLNCVVKNCWFKLADDLSANNGLGSIGILNCRAEEFAVADYLIQANIGCIFSNKNDLSDAGFGYTVKSLYTTIATGLGSMGVINFSGQNSILNFSKVRPALVLNGTNSFNFQGYISRSSTGGSGTNEAAILFSGLATYNATINGTVESFAQLLRVKGPLFNSSINCVVANQTNDGSAFPVGNTRHPLIDVTGSAWMHGCRINITFGNGQTEMDGRYMLYDGGANATQLLNTEIICSQWTNNNYIASPNLLAKSENSSFNTAQPFEKKTLSTNGIAYSQNISTSGWTVGSYNQIMPTGTLSNSTVFIMKITWGQNGVDYLVQSYVFPVSGTDFNGNSTAQILPVLTPTTATISWSNVGRSINVRYKAPTLTGQTSYGLEASISKSDMNNGTLTVTISPLL